LTQRIWPDYSNNGVEIPILDCRGAAILGDRLREAVQSIEALGAGVGGASDRAVDRGEIAPVVVAVLGGLAGGADILDDAVQGALAMLDEMPLNEMRQARGLSQKMLADILQVQQPSIAKMEKRTDMYVSRLRSHIEAMGGQLEVVARFPDGAVKISNFSDIGDSAAA